MEEAMVGKDASRLWQGVGSRTSATLVAVVLCGLLLSGCGDIGETLADLFRINGNGNGNGNAEAQEGDKLIETFQIAIETFQLETATPPEIQVSDGATRYTLQTTGEVRFMLQEGGARSFNLETGDIVVERPEQGLVTVLKDEDQ
jgi:hypothetical protein